MPSRLSTYHSYHTNLKTLGTIQTNILQSSATLASFVMTSPQAAWIIICLFHKSFMTNIHSSINQKFNPLYWFLNLYFNYVILCPWHIHSPSSRSDYNSTASIRLGNSLAHPKIQSFPGISRIKLFSWDIVFNCEATILRPPMYVH